MCIRDRDNITQSGQRIDVCANIGSREDVENVIRCDAGGIGLFRSEFLYMENGAKPPTEEQQFQAYKLAAESMDPKKVVIRTADLGGDKVAECLDCLLYTSVVEPFYCTFHYDTSIKIKINN